MNMIEIRSEDRLTGTPAGHVIRHAHPYPELIERIASENSNCGPVDVAAALLRGARVYGSFRSYRLAEVAAPARAEG